jgi:molybdopterin synthase catalytic subunit
MIEVRKEDFSADEIIAGIKKPEIGAIAIYVGTVRSFSGKKRIESLEFSVDEEAISKRLAEIEKSARDNFDIADTAIVHRVGTLRVSDNILLIAVSAAHREPAFEACGYIIDNIKIAHALWSKER